MNASWLIVTYKTPRTELLHLMGEIEKIGSSKHHIHVADNTYNKRGYAWGVNRLLERVLRTSTDVFIVCNPDICLPDASLQKLTEGLKEFDILGLAMQQNGKVYYGGEIDKLRMSGGLITKKPDQRFMPCDFVSGSLMIVSRKCVETIGLLDESYGMYYEDVDYCERARRMGLKVGIDSRLMYEHFEVSRHNKAKNRQLWNSRWKFWWRYGTWQSKLYEFIRLPKTLIEYLL